jgi:hypothetical protein
MRTFQTGDGIEHPQLNWWGSGTGSFTTSATLGWKAIFCELPYPAPDVDGHNPSHLPNEGAAVVLACFPV